MKSTPNTSFKRVPVTWLAYAMQGFYNYLQASIGLLIPFLREELMLSYSAVALHMSGFAVGLMLAGSTGEKLSSAWGRRVLLWRGSSGMSMGALTLVFGSHPTVTISGAVMMGFCGSMILMIVQAALSDFYGDQRTIALTEANIAGSVSAFLAPVAVGSLYAWGIGWRNAVVLAVLYVGLLYLGFRRQAIPGIKRASTQQMTAHQHLPVLYWAYWLVLFLGISVQWCIFAWGGDFLEMNAGLSKSQAATMLSLYFMAELIGRIGGSALARFMTASVMLIGAIILALAGFPLFWLGTTPLVIASGLFVTGLGIGNLFPFSLTLALSTAPTQTDLANARVVLAIGSAVLITPLCMGWVADATSIQIAYGIVPVILIGAALITVFGNQLGRQKSPQFIPINISSFRQENYGPRINANKHQ